MQVPSHFHLSHDCFAFYVLRCMQDLSAASPSLLDVCNTFCAPLNTLNVCPPHLLLLRLLMLLHRARTRVPTRQTTPRRPRRSRRSQHRQHLSQLHQSRHRVRRQFRRPPLLAPLRFPLRHRLLSAPPQPLLRIRLPISLRPPRRSSPGYWPRHRRWIQHSRCLPVRYLRLRKRRITISRSRLRCLHRCHCHRLPPTPCIRKSSWTCSWYANNQRSVFLSN